MKRICIFVFYDPDGIIDDYKLYLLDSLQTVISDIIIVINGEIKKNYLLRLNSFTNHIFIRENKGYDGGAYKDVITGKYENIKWNFWDEIILMNDTFYGPLFSWNNIFEEMEKGKYDFWGLSRCANSKLWEGTIVTEHIQAFFLVVRKKMFLSLQWELFWKNLEYPYSYLEAIKKFENYFTTYFCDNGFDYSTWLDHNNGGKYIIDGKNPYMKFSYEIIKYCKFPIIKYRVLSVVKYKNMVRILDYIEKETNYDKTLILKHINRLDREERMRPFGESELKKFVEFHDKIYIFGHGIYGKGLEEYFELKGWQIAGFIVSVPKEEKEKRIEESALEEKDAIIVAIANPDEVRDILLEHYKEEQLLFAKL